MRAEQVPQIIYEDEKTADEDVTHVERISNTDHGLDRDTEIVQDAVQDGPGVHQHVGNTCCYMCENRL